MNRESMRELGLFALLATFGVLGRWLEPAWNFTPLAAVTALGAYAFRGWAPAILLPATVLVVSDLLLPAHDSVVVMISVHVMALLPLLFGRAARNAEGWRCAGWWGLCAVAPGLAFFVVTNFAVWAFNNYYAHTWAGLVECYLRALPFYRWMLAGDIFYVSVAAGCAAAAHALERRSAAMATAKVSA